jgi:hypothetical protein
MLLHDHAIDPVAIVSSFVKKKQKAGKKITWSELSAILTKSNGCRW